MAYCRSLAGYSDAYVYADGYCTIHCRIRNKPGIFECREFFFRKDALYYLREKKALGCLIPDHALLRLESEIDFFGDELQEPYARDHSDIYMERLSDCIICHQCRLINPENYFIKINSDQSNLDECEKMWKKIVPAKFTSRNAAIEHIREHIASGHRVEQDAIERLKNEIGLLGDKVVADVTPLKAKYCSLKDSKKISTDTHDKHS